MIQGVCSGEASLRLSRTNGRASCTTFYLRAICAVCNHEGTCPMCYFRAIVLWVSLFLPVTSASANVLTPADYQSFQALDVKMLAIGDDLYALISADLERKRPDCLMQLAFKFDAVQADLHRISTLVGRLRPV